MRAVLGRLTGTDHRVVAVPEISGTPSRICRCGQSKRRVTPALTAASLGDGPGVSHSSVAFCWESILTGVSRHGRAARSP
jgi:hypothetical protein